MTGIKPQHFNFVDLPKQQRDLFVPHLNLVTANSRLAAFRLTANPAYRQLLPMYGWFSLYNLW